MPQGARQAYLEELADASQEWFQKRPKTPAELARRLNQLRQGCSTLILAGPLRETFLANDARTYVPQCPALCDGAVRGDHAGTRHPTLPTVLDQDLITPLGRQRQVVTGIAGSRIRVIPNAARTTMLESPAVFNTVVQEFLAPLGP